MASSLQEQILVGLDKIKDKAAIVNQFNKHFIQASSIFDSQM